MKIPDEEIKRTLHNCRLIHSPEDEKTIEYKASNFWIGAILVFSWTILGFIGLVTIILHFISK